MKERFTEKPNKQNPGRREETEPQRNPQRPNQYPGQKPDTRRP